jgi:hypothetical protein
MTRRADFPATELSRSERTRVRLPQPFTSARIFQGWGPDLSGR